MKSGNPSGLFFLSFLLFYIFPLSISGSEKVPPPRWAIKSNLLYWAATTPNVGFEYAVSNQLTLIIMRSYNPWQFGNREENKKFKHWIIQPAVRFWKCEKFQGSFWEIHTQYGRYNSGGIKLPFGLYPNLENHRYQGYLAGGGIGYGYQWLISGRWNLEAVIGLGYSYLNYDKYECHRCGEYKGKGDYHYLEPTKLGLSVVYFFK